MNNAIARFEKVSFQEYANAIYGKRELLPSESKIFEKNGKRSSFLKERPMVQQDMISICLTTDTLMKILQS